MKDNLPNLTNVLHQTGENYVCRLAGSVRIVFQEESIELTKGEFSKLVRLLSKRNTTEFISQLILHKNFLNRGTVRPLLLSLTGQELSELNDLAIQAKLLLDVYDILGY